MCVRVVLPWGPMTLNEQNEKSSPQKQKKKSYFTAFVYIDRQSTAQFVLGVSFAVAPWRLQIPTQEDQQQPNYFVEKCFIKTWQAAACRCCWPRLKNPSVDARLRTYTTTVLAYFHRGYMYYKGLKRTHKCADNTLTHQHEGLSRFRGNRQTWLWSDDSCSDSGNEIEGVQGSNWGLFCANFKLFYIN